MTAPAVSALAGRRVVVTRPREDAAGLVSALTSLGAEPVLFPTIAIRPMADLAPLDTALQRLDQYAWVVFTSANAVTIVLDRLRHLRRTLPDATRVAAVGSATAGALQARGVTADFVPSAFHGTGLAQELHDVFGRRVLVPQAAIAPADLARILGARGAEVEVVSVYHTVAAEPDRAVLAPPVDALTFASPSAVRRFAQLLGPEATRLAAGAVVACIGPVTAEAARSLGWVVSVEPREHTTAGLVLALVQYYHRRRVPA